MLSAHTIGLDVLGAQAAAPDRVITLRVRDPQGVASAKGGALGTIAASLLPDTIAQRVYDEMASQLRSNFAANGVGVDVAVVDAASVAGKSAPALPQDAKAFGRGALVGAAGIGLLSLLWAKFGGKR